MSFPELLSHKLLLKQRLTSNSGFTPSTLSCEELSGSRWCQNTETDQHALLYLHTHTHMWREGQRHASMKTKSFSFWCGIRHDHVPVSINYSCAHTQKLPLSEGLYCCDTQHNYLSEWKHECHADDAFTRSLSGSSSNRPMYTCFTHILHPAKPAVSKPTANCLPKVGCRFKSQVQKSQLCPWARLSSEPLINALHD